LTDRDQLALFGFVVDEVLQLRAETRCAIDLRLDVCRHDAFSCTILAVVEKPPSATCGWRITLNGSLRATRRGKEPARSNAEEDEDAAVFCPDLHMPSGDE
jgi:hypothetical protein